jgi:hypothetical protein
MTFNILKKIPVVEALSENFPSILGAVSPGIPFSKINPLKKTFKVVHVFKRNWLGPDLILQRKFLDNLLNCLFFKYKVFV